MKSVKNILLLTMVLLMPVLLAFGIVRISKQKAYNEARYTAKNRRYELAWEQFLALDDYRDSKDQAKNILSLLDMDKAAMAKLHPVPGCCFSEENTTIYFCKENLIGINIDWCLGAGPDFYAQWSEYCSADTEFANDFFRNGESFWSTNITSLIRYDPATGEYLFLQNIDDYALSNNFLPLEERYRGRINQDGTLELYNASGEYYVFELYAYIDDTSLKPIIVTPELTDLVNSCNR